VTLPPQRCRRITFPAPYGGAIDLHQMLLDLLLVLMGSIRGCESLVQALFNEGNVHDSSQIQTVCTAWCIQFRWQYRRITKLIEEKMHFTEQTLTRHRVIQKVSSLRPTGVESSFSVF